jgi:hypothetical protein
MLIPRFRFKLLPPVAKLPKKATVVDSPTLVFTLKLIKPIFIHAEKFFALTSGKRKQIKVFVISSEIISAAAFSSKLKSEIVDGKKVSGSLVKRRQKYLLSSDVIARGKMQKLLVKKNLRKTMKWSKVFLFKLNARSRMNVKA